MHSRFSPAPARVPWPLTFSFARALQQPALEIWAGAQENRDAAQQALLRRAGDNSAALRGDYAPRTETA
jgi:fructose-bisphosphate aldolase class I